LLEVKNFSEFSGLWQDASPVLQPQGIHSMSIKDLATDPNASQDAMLTDLEARILGSLMEKQLTTPDAYPLTLNSLLLACNQKTSREPLTNLNQGEVQRCLSNMQDRKLVDVDYGTRAQRYDQRLTRVLGVDKSVQAILNVMLLRGPQTAAELFARTQRMFEFANSEALEEKLQALCLKTSPLIIRIPRQSGQREDRYMHLLCGAPDLEALALSAVAPKKSSSSELDERVAILEQQVAVLQQQIQQLLTED
jgi:uncharacterized protein YceH (UPF0502 family)